MRTGGKKAIGATRSVESPVQRVDIKEWQQQNGLSAWTVADVDSKEWERERKLERLSLLNYVLDLI